MLASQSVSLWMSVLSIQLLHDVVADRACLSCLSLGHFSQLMTLFGTINEPIDNERDKNAPFCFEFLSNYSNQFVNVYSFVKCSGGGLGVHCPQKAKRIYG